MVRFTVADRQEITAAIHAAEQNTSGEFVAVVARSSDRYIASALLWAGGLALLMPGVLLLLPLHLRFVHIYQLQLLIFIGLSLLFRVRTTAAHGPGAQGISMPMRAGWPMPSSMSRACTSPANIRACCSSCPWRNTTWKWWRTRASTRSWAKPTGARWWIPSSATCSGTGDGRLRGRHHRLRRRHGGALPTRFEQCKRTLGWTNCNLVNHMSRYAVITLKITATSVFLAAGLVVSTTVYADAIDSKINNNISYGTLLKQKIAQLEQQQQVLLTQKNQLDVDNAQLVKDQEIYNNNVKQYSEQTDIHNQKIAEASRECRSLGPKKNLDQLAQASDTAAAGFSNFPTTNPDARQQEQYVHECRAKIKEVNSATAHMNAEETSLSDQQQDLEKRWMDIDVKNCGVEPARNPKS